MEKYYTTLVCLNGHCIDNYYEYTDENSIYYKKGNTNNQFSEICGEVIISQCPEYETPIRGSSPYSVLTNSKCSPQTIVIIVANHFLA